jgi:hypothetical protein
MTGGGWGMMSKDTARDSSSSSSRAIYEKENLGRGVN